MGGSSLTPQSTTQNFAHCLLAQKVTLASQIYKFQKQSSMFVGACVLLTDLCWPGRSWLGAKTPAAVWSITTWLQEALRFSLHSTRGRKSCTKERRCSLQTFLTGLFSYKVNVMINRASQTDFWMRTEAGLKFTAPADTFYLCAFASMQSMQEWMTSPKPSFATWFIPDQPYHITRSKYCILLPAPSVRSWMNCIVQQFQLCLDQRKSECNNGPCLLSQKIISSRKSIFGTKWLNTSTAVRIWNTHLHGLKTFASVWGLFE